MYKATTTSSAPTFFDEFVEKARTEGRLAARAHLPSLCQRCAPAATQRRARTRSEERAIAALIGMQTRVFGAHVLRVLPTTSVRRMSGGMDCEGTRLMFWATRRSPRNWRRRACGRWPCRALRRARRLRLGAAILHL